MKVSVGDQPRKRYSGEFQIRRDMSSMIPLRTTQDIARSLHPTCRCCSRHSFMNCGGVPFPGDGPQHRHTHAKPTTKLTTGPI